MFGRNRPQESNQARLNLRCSFCKKSHRDVRQLIAGPRVYICDECVQICVDFIAADRKGASDAALKDGRLATPPQWPVGSEMVRCGLCRMPTPASDALLIEHRGVLCCVLVA